MVKIRDYGLEVLTPIIQLFNHHFECTILQVYTTKEANITAGLILNVE